MASGTELVLMISLAILLRLGFLLISLNVVKKREQFTGSGPGSGGGHSGGGRGSGGGLGGHSGGHRGWGSGGGRGPYSGGGFNRMGDGGGGTGGYIGWDVRPGYMHLSDYDIRRPCQKDSDCNNNICSMSGYCLYYY